ncbi:MAG TPA: SRPBCC domain-containing protein [Cyclobacteriaceae bacterium]|nr:SRPBCC domain-containing protein [Cyclobacteriaceae bacterium]
MITGKITKQPDGYTVHFERILPHAIEEVWDAITNPEKLKFWFTDIEMELKPGATITFHFRDENKTVSHGKVVSVDRPNKFVFTWETELGVWELFNEGKNKCRLVLTYSRLADEYAVSAPAGFHILLDRLEGVLKGTRVIYPFGTEEYDPEFQAIHEAYEQSVLKEYPVLEKFRPVRVEKTYNASVEKVWKAITDKDQMKQWYFDLSEFKPVVGFEFEFKGQGSKGEQYTHHCRITEVVPLKRLTYSWAYEGYEGTSQVTFELFAEGNKTTLRLTHKGLHTFPDHPDFARSSFNAGWTELITILLQKFLEEARSV